MPLSVVEKGIKGVCEFYSETGTEGGYWAFQDARFMTRNHTLFACKKCHSYWDSAHDDVPSVFSESKEVLAILAKALREGVFISLLRSIFKKLCDKTLDELACLLGHHDWESSPEFFHSYDGLHTLRDGDELVIYDIEHPERIVWMGVISLKRHSVFTEHAYDMWIHADQAGIDRKTWARYFIKGYPAKLLPKKRYPVQK